MKDMLREVTEPSINDKYYLLGSRIGIGPHSDVFLGYDSADKEKTQVAIKRFTYEEPLANVLAANNEVSLLKRCFRSSHVVDCLDHCLDTRDTYIVMEHIPQTLDRKIRKKEVTLALVAAYIRQMPDLLADLRDAAVIHSDFKPANLGLKDEKIIALDLGLAKDFGLALYEDDVRSYKVKDVPSYNPPEMREMPDEEYPDVALVTPTCDTYSAGVTLSYLLIGQQANSIKELAKKVKRKHGIVLPQSMRKLYISMTHKKPLQRPHPEELKAMAWEAANDLLRADISKTIADWKKPRRMIDFFGEEPSASFPC